MLNVDKLIEFLELAEEETTKMASISKFEKEEDFQCKKICKELVNIVKNNFNQECDGYMIGPRAMGLSDGKAEMSFFLDIGQTQFLAERNYKRNLNELKQLENSLKRERNWKVVRFNRTLPLITVLYKPTNQKCELSTTNGLSVQISAMIGHFFEIQPEAIKFYHFIRTWPKINNVNFKQFVLTLLVVQFLQEKNLMPSVLNAQTNIPQNFIEGTAVSFDPSRDISSYRVKKMLYYYAYVRSFFRHYGNFNFDENVISTYYGYPIQKNEYTPKLDYDSPMCIAAFLNQKCNTSRHVTHFQVNKFMTVCEESYKFLADK